MRKTICPHCGSNNTASVDNYYHCSDCHTDFGRVALADDGSVLKDSIKGMRFRYGDLLTGSARIGFLEDKDGSCVYEVYDANEGGYDKVADTLDVQTWQEMKQHIVEDLFIMDWNKEYYPVNDGREISANNAWEFTLTVNGDEEYTFKGVDAYPIYWNNFMKLIEPYFDNLKQ